MTERKEDSPDKFEIFFADKITGEESKELSETSHAKLLSEAFESLSNELDKHGNTAEFQELRKKHSLKPYSLGDETISVVVCGVYEDEDSAVLQINRHTKTEKDEVQITADRGTGIDEFAYPPTIKSEVKFDPGEAPDIYYKVIFRRGRISTFERALIHTDSSYKRPYIKDIRTIDCSIFGVEV